jgi:hypothetical protein
MLEQITLQMASNRDLQMAMAAIPQGFVDELDGAFARIWFLAGCGETLRHAGISLACTSSQDYS